MLAGICLGAQAASMIELQYLDEDGDGARYPTRLLVTAQYLRLDDGNDAGDFILFDRRSGDVVNVLNDRKMLVRVTRQPLPAVRPRAYVVEEKVTAAGKGRVRVQRYADGALCSESVIQPRRFPDAARALAEYKSTLAFTQLQTYLNTPEELRQTCDLVEHVWEGRRALAHGLPLEERDYSGRVRTYVKGGRKAYEANLFRLPEGFSTLQLPVNVNESAESIQPSRVQVR